MLRKLERAVDWNNMATPAAYQQLDTFWSQRLPNARSELVTLITEPPQQKLELSETNKCTQRHNA